MHFPKPSGNHSLILLIFSKIKWMAEMKFIIINWRKIGSRDIRIHNQFYEAIAKLNYKGIRTFLHLKFKSICSLIS